MACNLLFYQPMTLNSRIKEISFLPILILVAFLGLACGDEAVVDDTGATKDTEETATDPSPDANLAQCRAVGCHKDVCTDEEEVTTECEGGIFISCFATATCERQESGECGFRMTQKLVTCLDKFNITP